MCPFFIGSAAYDVFSKFDFYVKLCYTNNRGYPYIKLTLPTLLIGEKDMEIKTFEARYELVEFCYYIDNTLPNGQISVIELLVNTEDIDFLEQELSNTFAIETDKQIYIYSGYEVSECYEEDNGLVKVVCIK